MNTNLSIPVGGMYQEWMSLIDVVEEDTARRLSIMASKGGWREIQPKEATEMGFLELVEWSQPETDALVLVDEDYLVCLPKKSFNTGGN